MPTVEIRSARLEDLDGVNDIFNYYIPRSTIMFQDKPTTPAERRAWFDARNGTYPVLVATLGNEVVGWASAGPYYKPAPARCTFEDSIYVHHERHRMGIGRALMAELLSQTRAAGAHSIVAEIHDEIGSLALHASFGFKEVGRISEAGFKLGKWVDVVLMQLKF